MCLWVLVYFVCVEVKCQSLICMIDFVLRVASPGCHNKQINIQTVCIVLRMVCVYVDGLVQKRRNSSALAMELRLSGNKPSINYGSCSRLAPFGILAVYYCSKFTYIFQVYLSGAWIIALYNVTIALYLLPIYLFNLRLQNVMCVRLIGWWNRCIGGLK